MGSEQSKGNSSGSDCGYKWNSRLNISVPASPRALSSDNCLASDNEHAFSMEPIGVCVPTPPSTIATRPFGKISAGLNPFSHSPSSPFYAPLHHHNFGQSPLSGSLKGDILNRGFDHDWHHSADSIQAGAKIGTGVVACPPGSSSAHVSADTLAKTGSFGYPPNEAAIKSKAAKEASANALKKLDK